jgi:hypothetical protein
LASPSLKELEIMAEHTKVNVAALANFGTKTAEQTFKSYASGAGALAANRAGETIGRVGTNEARTFQAYYQGMTEALGYFQRDSGKGFQALGFGAVVMAANYHQGDLSQAKAMDDINAMFEPTPGKPAPETGKTVVGTTPIKKLPPPTRTLNPSPTYQPPSPQEQVNEHRRLYGKDEHLPADRHGRHEAPGPGPFERRGQTGSGTVGE